MLASIAGVVCCTRGAPSRRQTELVTFSDFSATFHHHRQLPLAPVLELVLVLSVSVLSTLSIS
jgi:hypothetical protein